MHYPGQPPISKAWIGPPDTGGDPSYSNAARGPIDAWVAVEICRALIQRGELGPDRPVPLRRTRPTESRSFKGEVRMPCQPHLAMTVDWDEQRDGWDGNMRWAYSVACTQELDPAYRAPWNPLQVHEERDREVRRRAMVRDFSGVPSYMVDATPQRRFASREGA